MKVLIQPVSLKTSYAEISCGSYWLFEFATAGINVFSVSCFRHSCGYRSHLSALRRLICFLWIIRVSESSTRVQSVQASILLQFKIGNGINESILNWVESEPCAAWTGVLCDDYGFISRIVLSDQTTAILPNVFIPPTLAAESGNSIVGEILAVVGSITSLEILVICNTAINGTIPQTLTNLKMLQTLVLAGNQLSGKIPSFLGSLSRLRTLNLSQNLLSGPIPNSIGQLTLLEILDLSENAKSGSVPVPTLFGPIPTEIANLTSLAILNLAKNGLSGICPMLFGMTNLVSIDLSGCNLTGDISVILGLHPKLETLDMSFNSFYGEIPGVVSQYYNLQILDLSENKRISGTIPDSISLLPLKTLDLGSNSLQSLSPGLFNISSLIALTLRYNNFSGPLPSSIGHLPKLTYLDLSHNGFNGSFPSFSPAMNLQFIDLSYNGFQGGFEAFGNLPSLNSLFLDFTNISGPIPLSILGLTNLQTLSCKRCLLNGTIPDGIGGLSQLSQLDLSENNLTGVIPSSIGNLSFMGSLFLQSNQLTGIIPDQLSNLDVSILLDFQAYNNQLMGVIPQWLGSFTSLSTLILSGNKFGGEIPSEIGSLWMLTVLDLSSNRLTGSIPTSLSNMGSLEHLLLSNNDLYGSIPPEIGSLSNLQTLEIRNTAIGGALPSELGNLNSLTTLALSVNYLEGVIPPGFFANFSNLVAVSISGTSLQGSIPDISGLSSLQTLDFSSNRLKGILPPFPPGILDVDVSTNKLTGNLSVLENCHNLTSIVADNNNFTGYLPIFANVSVVSLSGNNLTWPASINFTGKNNWDLSGNPICTDLALLNSTVCQRNASGLKYQANTVCPGVTCTGDLKPNPSNCVCGPLASFNLTIFPTFISLFTESNAMHIQNFFSKKLALPNSMVQVEQASSNPLGRVTLSVNFFSGGKSVAGNLIPSILDIISPTGKTYQGTEILNLGFVHLADFSVFNPTESDQSTNKPVATNAGHPAPRTWIVVVACLIAVAVVLAIYLMKSFFSILPRQTSFDKRVRSNFVKVFSLHDIHKATQRFSRDNLLGHGGYGAVYIGTATSGEKWAVKRAKRISNEGLLLFHTEVDLISSLNHSNIVKLLGYCEEQKEQILVYEFMAHGTLKERLTRSRAGTVSFSFEDRVATAIAVAEGIRYLHNYANRTIIHRDIKSENILFDSDDSAKIADFGLLRDRFKSQTSKMVAGTPGYIDPEYCHTYKVTTKSDVYSFGVVVLELITGKPALIKDRNFLPQEAGYSCSLAEWAIERRSNLGAIVDRNLLVRTQEAFSLFAQAAFMCVEKLGKDRPTMDEVCRWLSEVKEKCSDGATWRASGNSAIQSSIEMRACLVDEDVANSNIGSPLLTDSASIFS